MISFEQAFKNHLNEMQFLFDDHSSSLKMPDFRLLKYCEGRDLFVDVKEKRQRINVKNWDLVSADNEPFTFIIDDLAARKMLAYAPFSGLVVRDNLHKSYYWFSILDLFLMPKIRINRPIEKSVKTFKGKWLIDFRNAKKSEDLEGIFREIDDYLANRLENYTQVLACFGDYVGEDIAQQGETRKPAHWEIDVKATR